MIDDSLVASPRSNYWYVAAQQPCRRSILENGVPLFLRICVPCCCGCGENRSNFKIPSLYISWTLFFQEMALLRTNSITVSLSLSLSLSLTSSKSMGDTQMTVTLIHGFDMSFWYNSYGSISRDSPVPVLYEYPYYRYLL